MASSKPKVSKAEFVAVLAVLAQKNRPAYREIRKEAWESLVFTPSSNSQN